MSEPYMEHPTGNFDSAVKAMGDALSRLRREARWPGPIVFGAQGYGGKPDTYQFAEVRLLADTLSLEGGPLDLAAIRAAAQVGAMAIVPVGAQYSLERATPLEAASILDAIFRCHFAVRPFPDEGDDYAVGAEWCE